MRNWLHHCMRHLTSLANRHLMASREFQKYPVITRTIDTRLSLGHHSELEVLKYEMGRYSGTGRWVVLVAPPYHLPSSLFRQAGIDPARCMVIRVRSVEAKLCAVQQALYDQNVGMVIFWSTPLGKYSVQQLESRVQQEGISCIHFLLDPPLQKPVASLPIAA